MGGHMNSALTNRRSDTAVEPASLAGLGSRDEPTVMQVSRVCRLSDRLLLLAFRRVDGLDFTFHPGQFCRVAVPAAAGYVWRSYSIATPAHEGGASDTCEIAVTAMPGGLATDYLFALRTGDHVRVSGPFGRLVLPREDPAHYVLIGTGTGMAPFRAMLPELDRRAAVRPFQVTILMGIRAPAERLYHADFVRFAECAPGARRLFISYSREMPTEPTRFESVGYVQDLLRNISLDPERDRVMLCGNPNMIDDCSAFLMERGFEKTRLLREKYLPGPRHAQAPGSQR